MANVTYTPSAPFEDASDNEVKCIITVHVNGRYEDTMVVSWYAGMLEKRKSLICTASD